MKCYCFQFTAFQKKKLRVFALQVSISVSAFYQIDYYQIVVH